jgi:hypothetical protein
LEQEQFESIYVTQQKWIKQIDENERVISKLKAQLQKYENSNSSWDNLTLFYSIFLIFVIYLYINKVIYYIKNNILLYY